MCEDDAQGQSGGEAEGHEDVIPERYSVDSLHAQIVGPDRVFIYWELGGGASEELLQQGDPEHVWILRVTELTTGSHRDIPVDPSDGNRYLRAEAGRRYAFELGVARQGTFRRVCQTTEIRLPGGEPQPVESVEWVQITGTSPERGKESTDRPRKNARARKLAGLSYEATVEYIGLSSMS